MAEVTAELNLKIAGLQAGLEKARAEMAGFKKYAQTQGDGVGNAFTSGLRSAIGGITVAGVIGGVKSLVEEYGHLADLSQRFETSPEGMQRLEYHAKLAGTTLESAANSVSKLQVALERTNDPGVVAALRELRISAVTLAGESPERQIELLADAFNRAQQEGRGLSATRDLLGKGFAELIPMLREWNEIAKNKIPFVSDKDVATLKEFGDEYEKLKMRMKVAAAKALMDPAASAGSGSPNDKMSGGAAAFMGQGFGVGRTIEEAIKEKEASTGNWMGGMLDLLGKSEDLAKRFNTKLESYNRITAEAAESAKKAQAEAAKLAKAANKAAEGVTAEEQDVRIKELRGAGRGKEAEKLERLKKGQQEFQRLRDAHPEMGEAWALQMAHRKDAAEHMVPGRIQGYKGTGGSKPGEGLDWLYGHNRDRGGQAQNKEFKFPALEEMNRTLKDIHDAVR